MKLSIRTRAEIYLLFMTVVWGSTFVLTKFILKNASPFVYVALRFIIATLLFYLLFNRKLSAIPKDAIIRGSILGVFLFLGFMPQTIGLKYTTASKSAFITGLTVVFTPILQILIERNLPKIGNIIGVVIVTAGLYLITSPKGSEVNIGDVLTLICAVIFSLYIIYMDIFGKKHDPAHLTFIQFVTTSVLAAISIPFLEIPYLSIDNSFLLNLFYLSVMPTVVALYILTKYQKYTTPTRSAVIYSMEPPIAAIFAFFIIGEQLGLLGILGGILILFGLIMSELSDVLFKHRKEKELAPLPDKPIK
jgi:drug/metabolite transporter (DMT)-like permease